jgi:hypothetical protein
MFSEILGVVRWMLEGRAKLAYFMGWFLPLNLVLSTNFGRLAQRQSIGLTLRKHTFLADSFSLHLIAYPV